MAYFRCGNGNSGGGGGDFDETLLYENPSPTSGFNSGALIFISSSELLSYKYLRFEFLNKYNLTVTDSNISKDIWSSEDFVSPSAAGSGASPYLRLDSKYFVRGIVYSGGRYIHSNRCINTTDDVGTDYYLVPYRIYGLK